MLQIWTMFLHELTQTNSFRLFIGQREYFLCNSIPQLQESHNYSVVCVDVGNGWDVSQEHYGAVQKRIYKKICHLSQKDVFFQYVKIPLQKVIQVSLTCTVCDFTAWDSQWNFLCSPHYYYYFFQVHWLSHCPKPHWLTTHINCPQV